MNLIAQIRIIKNKEYYTKSGRVVYGGGGITPDIIIENDITYNKSTREIYFHSDRLLFKYADQTKNHMNTKTNNVESSYNNFIKDYVVNQNDFVTWLDSAKIDYDKEEITNNPDWEFISKRIKAELANTTWGREYFYKTLINDDVQVKEAKKQFEFARTLLE